MDGHVVGDKTDGATLTLTGFHTPLPTRGQFDIHLVAGAQSRAA